MLWRCPAVLMISAALTALSLLMLCASMFIFTFGSSASAFRVPTLWFIDLTVTTSYMYTQYTFLSFCQFFFPQENGEKKENT